MTTPPRRSTSANLASLLREFELSKELLVRLVTPEIDQDRPGRTGAADDAGPVDALRSVADDADRTDQSDRPDRDDRSDEDQPAEEVLADALATLRQLILGHPTAARAIVGFLVGEGRRRAMTEPGAARYHSMVRSPEVERLRTIWEKVTLNLLDDQTDGAAVPDAWVELIRDLAAGSGLDRVADQLRPDGLT